jgi:hypothetical protein
MGEQLMAPLFSIVALMALIFMTLKRTAWALVYSLDDPYIHLVLARNIQQGSYGINPGEWASPASSIVWPFLMALVPPGWMEWAPLVFNAVVCILSVHYLSLAFQGSSLPKWAQALAVVGIAFGMNLFGLVLTGMEHTLQVFLVIFVAQRLTVAHYDKWFYLALGLMPLIRYECLALTLPVCVYLWFTADKIRPMVTALVTVAIVAAFSAFLHSKGLPLLPSSVLAKADGSHLKDNVVGHPEIFTMLAWLAYIYRDRMWQFALYFLLPVIAFMIGGRVGWMGRYEVFMLAWLIVFLIRSAVDMDTRLSAPAGPGASAKVTLLMSVALTMAFPTLMRCTLLTPLGSQNIAQQQVVMAAIAHDLARPVAVNDLGLVAMRSGQYVLDLWGLGSIEALQARRSGQSSKRWLADIMGRKGIEYAFIFDEWFPERPDDWIKVAELELDSPQMTAGDTKVALYARNPAAAAHLREVVSALAQQPRNKALIHLM